MYFNEGCTCKHGQYVMADEGPFCLVVLPVTQLTVKSSSLPV